MNDLATKSESLPVQFTGAQSSIIERAFASEDFDKIVERCNYIAKSDFVPDSFKGSGANVLMALELGRSIGISAVSSLQHIAFVNNRATIWGDALPAVVMAHGGDILKEEIGEPFKDDYGFRVTVSRPGRSESVETFTVADAKKSGLWMKKGPWQDYPKQMLFYRARAFAIRQQYADVLSGVTLREEAEDMIDVTPARPQPASATHTSDAPASRSDEVLARLGGKSSPADAEDATESPESADSLKASSEISAQDGRDDAKQAGSGDLIPEDGGSEDAPELELDAATLTALSPASLGDLLGKTTTKAEIQTIESFIAKGKDGFTASQLSKLKKQCQDARDRVGNIAGNA